MILSCSTPQKITASTVGFATLRNYAINPNLLLSDEINYAFVGNADVFHQMFSMTKAASGAAVVPNFATQSVIAIILKPTEKVVSIDINKAELTGHQLNIFYTITDTTSWKNYSHVPVAVASIAKNNMVKQINFYTGGNKEKTIKVVY